MEISMCFLLMLSLHTSRAIPDDGAVDYTRHKVIRVFTRSIEHQEIVNSLTDNPKYNVDIWDESVANGSVDLHIRPDVYNELTSSLNTSSISYQVLIADLQSLIDREKAETEAYQSSRKKRAAGVEGTVEPVENADNFDDFIFGGQPETGRQDAGQQVEGQPVVGELKSILFNYPRHTEIVEWLFAVKQYRPNIVKLFEIGRSYEGRVMHVIKIGASNVSRPAIWIDGGIHAREWISPATAVYVIYCLVAGYEKNPVITILVQEFDWFILPVMNPDGYEYSHTTDRMWRKTRSRPAGSLRRCPGVDGNRNFDFQWLSECDGHPNQRCRGKQQCDDTYAGKQPFSEAETISTANFIIQHKNELKMYISLHSYSQLWLTPWGYTRVHPNDYDDLMRVARKGVKSLKDRHGIIYEIGSPAEILYAATGGSYDWAKGVAGIKYSYTIELRDKGAHGFMLPMPQILPTCEETWSAIIAAVAEMATSDRCWVYKTDCPRAVTTQ